MVQKAFVIVSLNWISFANGVVFGQVASMIGALQKKDDGIELGESQISLIASTMITVSLFGSGLSAVATDKLGRRWPFILFSIPIIINWLILYHAKELYQFMLSRVIGGVAVGALWTLNIFVTSEYTSPKTRAFFLNMGTTVSPAFGTCIAHAIGTFLHWRTVVLISIFPSALAIVLPYFWVESPHWLASKGRFDECEIAFRKLHGTSEHSDKQLHLLLTMEKCKLETANEINCKPTRSKLLLMFKRRYYWELFVLSLFMNAYITASGKVIFSLLAPIMLEEITESSNVFTFTLLIDGFIILGSFMSCFLIRKTSLRTLLFSTGFAANVILVLFSVCFYFKSVKTYFNWINVILLGMYFIIINAGPYPLLEAIYSEMFPLELKMYIFSLSVIVLVGALTLSIVLLPYTVGSIGYHGLFLLNAAITSISLVYIWIKLPETKGKTLQEIETYFKTRNFDLDEVIRNEQSHALL